MKRAGDLEQCLQLITQKNQEELKGLDDVGRSWLSIALAGMLTFPLHRSVGGCRGAKNYQMYTKRNGRRHLEERGPSCTRPYHEPGEVSGSGK
jgi:hypothetical protein